MNLPTKAPVTLDSLFDAGAHFAQRKNRRHPSMKKFLVGSKANVELVDLSQTLTQLEAAQAALAQYAKEGKTILFVGGKREISDIVKEAAESVGSPYVAGRWLGGTITNFVEIKKRIDRLADLTSQRESGDLAKKYTKLERLFIDREITRLEERLGGIRAISKRPDVFVIVDTNAEAFAVREARRAGIPVVGVMSSDCNVQDADYPVVANDASRKTVALILKALASGIATGARGE